MNGEVAERLGVATCMVSGVKTFEDVLYAEVRAVTSKAKSLGVKNGVQGLEALRLML